MASTDITTLKPADIFGSTLNTSFSVGSGAGVLFVATANGVVTGTDAASAIGSGVGSLTIPANYLVAGRTLRVTMAGSLTTPTLTDGTGRYILKYGSTTLLLQDVDLGLNRTTRWIFDAWVTCRSVSGVNGSLACNGAMTATTVSGASVSPASPFIPITADITSDKALDFTWDWVQDGGTFTCHNAIVEVLS